MQNKIDNLEIQKIDILKQIEITQQSRIKKRSVNSSMYLDLVDRHLREIEEKLRSSSMRRLTLKIRQIIGFDNELAIKLISTVDSYKEELVALNNSIDALVYSPNIEKLTERREAIVHSIMEQIPHPKSLVKNEIKQAEERLKERQATSEKKIDILKGNLKTVETKFEEANSQLTEAASKYASLELPSFSKTFKKTAKEYKVSSYSKHAQDAVTTFSGNLFKPETLLKIWNTFAS